MQIIPNFVDMAKSPEELKEERLDSVAPAYPRDIYPYGLCISLCEEELKKLDLSGDVDAGDLIHMHAIGKVTSVSKRDTDDGQKVRVEIQITHLALEDEAHEDEEAEAEMRRVDYRKMYKE